MNQPTNGAGTKDWENASRSLQISYVSSVAPGMYAAMPIDLGLSLGTVPAMRPLPSDFMESVEEYRRLENSLEESEK